MKTQLSLRQNKIIQILRNSNTYMTSDEISKTLNVSSKTVRTDIADINNALSSDGISIDSVKGKGFVLYADDPELLKKLSKDNKIFLGQSDRVFYLAVRLCTAEEPINFYDLEDEIAISSSTLTGDLTSFKNRFVRGVPYIKLNIEKNELWLEDDERKRRFILAKLLSDNWDYNSTGNVYYESDFIDSDAFAAINSVVAGVLFKHGIYMDDYSLISLNLYLSITYHRLKEGHDLNVPLSDEMLPDEILPACKELFSVLEEKLGFAYPENEITETAYIIDETRLHSKEEFKARSFPEKYHRMVSDYLDRIYDVYGIYLKDDDEFCDRLISFIAHLFRPMKDLTVRDTADHIKQHLFVEFDMAVLFHKIAENECNITENDLLYLTWAIAGSFQSFFQRHPEQRFNTVLMSHMSVHSMWSLREALKNHFGGYLNITEVIPVNQKDFYDFSDTDLILATVSKKITIPGKELLQISPYLTREDSYRLANYTRDKKIQKLYPRKVISVCELLRNAFVHENMNFSSQYDLIEFICQDFINEGIFTQEHMFTILKRESVSTFAVNPALLLLYSTTPCTETKLSVLTLDHRIMWNKYKIRIVFMVSLAKEDTNEIIYLQNELFHRHFDSEVLKNFKSIDEIKSYYDKPELQ